MSTPVKSQRNAALKSLRRSQRSQKKRRGLLSKLFSRHRDARAQPTPMIHDTDDTNTTGIITPEVASQAEDMVAPRAEEEDQKMDTSETQEKRSTSSTSDRGSTRKPRTKISFSSARTRRPRDVLNWLRWRSELNQHLTNHILSGNKVDMDDVAIRAVSESVDRDALKAILKAAYAKDHTTLDQVAYLVFGVPRIHDKENLNAIPPSPKNRIGPEMKTRRSVLDAVYATSQGQQNNQPAKLPQVTPKSPPNSYLPPRDPAAEIINHSFLQHRDQVPGNVNHSKGPQIPPKSYIQSQNNNAPMQTTNGPANKMPIYATPMKPVAGMYRNICNRQNQGYPPYGVPRKTNRASVNKYAVSPACKASPRRSQNGVQENGGRRSKKHKDPNRCPTIDENFTMEYYHEANKVARERRQESHQVQKEYQEQEEVMEDPEIDYESSVEQDEEDEGDGEDQVAPPMLAEPMENPRRRSRRGNRSRAGTPKGWAPSMAEILKAKSVLSPIASPGHSPPGSPVRQRQIMPKYGPPPVINRGRIGTPQGSAPVSRQTSNASSSITLPGQRPSQGYVTRVRCDSNLSSLPDSVAHVGTRRRLSDLSSTAYSPTPPLPPYGPFCDEPGGPYRRPIPPPVAPKPRGNVRPVPCPPPPPPIQAYQEPHSNFRRPVYQPGGPGLPSDLMRAIELNRKPSNLSSVGPTYAS